MQLCFGLEFDDNPWPGPLSNKTAVLGESWMGPMGLLTLLEVQLGLTARVAPQSIRAAYLSQRIRSTTGFWAESANIDPFGVASELLRWRDFLLMQGWREQAVSARLAQLAEATDAVMPGTPDRLRNVLTALNEQATEIGRITVLGHSERELPALWRQVFAALTNAGTAFVYKPLAPVVATGDLAHCREPEFDPSGDGTLQLLRPDTALEAAEQVAAWLAAQPNLSRTVILGADVLLDSALRRQGLPTGGPAGHPSDNLLLQIMPLALELSWAPQDPLLALDLLLLATGPVPPSIGRRLLNALHEWPAVDSDDWRQAVGEGLSTINDEKQRLKLRGRIDELLRCTVSSCKYPKKEIDKRLTCLVGWLQSRVPTADRDRELWEAAVVQCVRLGQLCELSGLDTFSRPQLQRLTRDASIDIPAPARFEAQAGLHFTRSVGAVAGAAARIVWWDFTFDAAKLIRQLPLTREEIEALRTIGVELPDPGATAEQLSCTWRRPFEQSEQTLLLVCPRVASDGEERRTHPVWDEYSANLDPMQAAKLVRREPMGLNRTRKLEPLASARRVAVWNIADGQTIPAPETVSPTAGGSLIACPFQWVLKHHIGLQGAVCADLPSGSLLMGKLVHRVFEIVLKRKMAGEEHTADQWAAEAGGLFDVEGPRLAAEFFAPGSERTKAEIKRHAADSVKILLRHIELLGAKVSAVESTLEGVSSGLRFKCRPDLLLEAPAMVLDMKWSGGRRRREELRTGVGYQLAVYAKLADKGMFPAAGFFVLDEQRLLLIGATRVPGAELIEGPPLLETFESFVGAYAERRRELDSGEIKAEYERTDESSCLAEGILSLSPFCDYCDYRVFCRNEEVA